MDNKCTKLYCIFSYKEMIFMIRQHLSKNKSCLIKAILKMNVIKKFRFYVFLSLFAHHFHIDPDCIDRIRKRNAFGVMRQNIFSHKYLKSRDIGRDIIFNHKF